MRRPLPLPAAPRRAVDKLRPQHSRRLARRRLGGPEQASAHDVIVGLVRDSLADLHAADVDFFRHNPDRDFRLRAAWWMELAAIGLVSNNRPHLLLPEGVHLSAVVPRGAGPGLRERRFAINGVDLIDKEPTDNASLGFLYAMAEPVEAFAMGACA